MAVNINGTALKNLNVNGSKMKQLNVNGTKFWSSEEYLLQNGVVQSLAGGFTHYAQQYNSALTYQNGYMHMIIIKTIKHTLNMSNIFSPLLLLIVLFNVFIFICSCSS